MSGTIWRFVNSAYGTEIKVHDADSAFHLEQLLKSFGGNSQWHLEIVTSVEMTRSAPQRETAPPAQPIAEPAPEPVPAAPTAAAAIPKRPLLRSPRSTPENAPVPATPAAAASLKTPSAPVSAPAPTPTVAPVATPMAAPISAPVSAPIAPPEPIAVAESVSPPPQAAPAPAAPKNADNRRRHERYTARFRVIITSRNVSFQTFSTDISVGGMRLQRKVPETLLNKPCKIFISSADATEKLELDCQVIPDGNPLRVRFAELGASVKIQLEEWINRGVKLRRGVA